MNIIQTITGFISGILISVISIINPSSKMATSLPFHVPISPTPIIYQIIPTETMFPEEISIPTTYNPSERALKAAAFIYVNLDEKSQKDQQNTMLATGSADLTIRKMAIKLDNNPAKLALVEAVIEKYNKDQNTGVNNRNVPDYSSQSNPNNYDNTNQQPQTNDSYDSLKKYQEQIDQMNKQNCQDQINKYTICLADYNAKLNEYQECYSRYTGNSNLHPEFLCTKPSNFCYKPFCAF